MEIKQLLDGREVSLAEVLEARERRVTRQAEALKYGTCLISFTLNMPGPVKQFSLARAFFEYGLLRLERALAQKRFSVKRKKEFFEAAGSEAFWTVDAPALEVKRITTALEESSPASRLYDMDVIDERGVKVERGQVGLPPRRCIVCGREVMECAPRRAHSAEELARTAVRLMYDDECCRFSDLVSAAAQKALLYEVCVTPKPGLVDRFNNGSHNDMDVFTFVDSAVSLVPYFRQCVSLGIEHSERPLSKLFPILRLPGMEAEERMYLATEGVNAHKGAIFSLGIFCAARGWLWGNGMASEPDALQQAVEDMLECLPNELGSGTTTAGEKIFLSSGVTGVRGEAAAGYPHVFQTALPLFEKLLKKGKSVNDAAAVVLLRLICSLDDTNMIKRSSLDRFRQEQIRIKKMLDNETSLTLDKITELDRWFIQNNLSPGGSADLLAVTLFLHFLKPYKTATPSWHAIAI